MLQDLWDRTIPQEQPTDRHEEPNRNRWSQSIQDRGRDVGPQERLHAGQGIVRPRGGTDSDLPSARGDPNRSGCLPA
jgi:hypothetical protein